MEKMPEYQLEGMPYYKKDHYWVTPTNFSEESKKGLPESLIIHDVTLRDGEQTPGVTFLEDERVRIAEALSDLGVTRIEAGMPAVSEVAANALRRIVKANLKSQIFGFARAVDKDINLCIDAGVEGVIIEHTVNPYLCKYAYHLTPKATADRLIKSIKQAKKAGLYTVFMGWDWFRTPIEFTKWLVGELVAATDLDGVTIVDTYGCTVPAAAESMLRNFTTWYPKLNFEFHGHNDFSLGNACSLAAMRGGAKVIHTAMNGLGERQGNVATEELAMMLEMLQGIKTGVDLSKIYRTSQVISAISKMEIYPNKPILGRRSYQIESGITTHYMPMMEEQQIIPSYAPFTPVVTGRPGNIEFVLGKNSGKASIEIYLRKNNLTATDEEIDEMVTAVKAEGLVTKSLVSEEQFLEIVKKVKANKK